MRPVTLLALVAVLAPSVLTAQGKAPHPVPTVPHAQPAPKGTIAVGETVRDSLTRHDPLLLGDSTYAQQWRLPGNPGTTGPIGPRPHALEAYVFQLGLAPESER